jgi:hypothetical protein
LNETVHRWEGRWEDVAMTGNAISGSSASSVWLVSRGGVVMEMKNGSAVAHPLPLKKSGLDIAVAGIGKVYVTATDRSIYQWNDPEWIELQGQMAMRIDVAPDGGKRGEIWVVDDAGTVHKLLPGQGRETQRDVVAKDIAAGANGEVYALGKDDWLFKKDGLTWNRVNGSKIDGATGVDIDSSGRVWVVGPSGGVQRLSFVGSYANWIPYSRYDIGAADVAAIALP